MHTPGAQALKSVHPAAKMCMQGAPLISNTDNPISSEEHLVKLPGALFWLPIMHSVSQCMEQSLNFEHCKAFVCILISMLKIESCTQAFPVSTTPFFVPFRVVHIDSFNLKKRFKIPTDLPYISSK